MPLRWRGDLVQGRALPRGTGVGGGQEPDCAGRGQVPFPGPDEVTVLATATCHLRRLQSKNGKQQVPLSTATVSMVHSVPELMVSSEVSREQRPLCGHACPAPQEPHAHQVS